MILFQHVYIEFFLLNTELQKRQDDMMVAEDVRVGPSGVLECNRVWSDTSIKTKIFYSGEFFIVQMDDEEIADFHTPDHEHIHDEDEE
jgi:hypothetical protein